MCLCGYSIVCAARHLVPPAPGRLDGGESAGCSLINDYIVCVCVCILQSVLQDISSHQRLVDSVVEKAQGVLQSTSNSDVASFITSISSRYEKLASDAKVSHTLFAR